MKFVNSNTSVSKTQIQVGRESYYHLVKSEQPEDDSK